MRYYDIGDGQKDLLALLDEIADSHEQVTITRDGVGVAIILPLAKPKPEENPYPLRGKQFWIADDFDDPMPASWFGSDE